MHDEMLILRDRLAAIDNALGRLATPADGTAYRVFRVYDAGHIPASLPKFFACRPVDVGGTEAEGATATTTEESGVTEYVGVFGGKVPVAGDYLVASIVGGRWLAEHGGQSDRSNCTNCPDRFLPRFLYMTGLPFLDSVTLDAGLFGGHGACTWQGGGTFSFNRTSCPDPHHFGGSDVFTCRGPVTASVRVSFSLGVFGGAGGVTISFPGNFHCPGPSSTVTQGDEYAFGLSGSGNCGSIPFCFAGTGSLVSCDPFEWTGTLTGLRDSLAGLTMYTASGCQNDIDVTISESAPTPLVRASRRDPDAADWAAVLRCPDREELPSLGCCNGTVARCRAGHAVDPRGTVDRAECLACVRARRPIVTP